MIFLVRAAEMGGMTKPSMQDKRPTLEVRCGGLYLVVQRIPGWFTALLVMAAGAGLTWIGAR